MEFAAENEVAVISERIATRNQRLGIPEDTTRDDEDERQATDLNNQLLDSVNVIVNVAVKSKNLKGTFKKALKDAAEAIKNTGKVLLQRTASEESKRLQVENKRLQSEMDGLREELGQLRKDMEAIKKNIRTVSATKDIGMEPVAMPPLPTQRNRCEVEAPTIDSALDQFRQSIMVSVGNMVNARMESLEGRLPPEKPVRPLLQKARAANSSAMPATTTTKATRTTVEPESLNSLLNNKAKATTVNPKRKERGTKQLPPAPQAMSEAWTTVVKNKGAKGRKSVAAKPASATATASRAPKKKPPKLRAPKTSVVVITLQPGAAERGVKFSEVLTAAKRNINLADHGITSLKIRQAVTGARILEVPGTDSRERADVLAEKLRGALPQEDVYISRPVKCAEIRITGLDDSVLPEDVVTAVSRVAVCSVDAIKTGEIRRSPSGMGTIWVRCPVEAAKKVTDGGKLLVGWVSAQAKLLEPRPMRCYRCLKTGHVSRMCTEEADRSDLCYRCGQAGHKAAKCSAKPHCPLCAVGGKKADHIAGGRACFPPSANKGKGTAVRTPAVGSTAATNRPPENREEELMEINQI